MPMRTCLWSCLRCEVRCIWDVSRLCPRIYGQVKFSNAHSLFFHSLGFLHSPHQNLFLAIKLLCEIPATHSFRRLLHRSKQSGSLLVCGYPRARAPLPQMVEKKLAHCEEVMYIIWRMLKISWLSSVIYIQCRRLKKNTGWQSKIVMLMRQNLQHLKSSWALKPTKLCAKLALVPLCRDNIRRAPVLTGTMQAAACSGLTAVGQWATICSCKVDRNYARLWGSALYRK